MLIEQISQTDSPNVSSPAPPNLRDLALSYAARGWPVFRLQPGGKLPLAGSRGHLDATTDAETIRAWWTDFLTGSSTDHNIGIRPVAGAFSVIDLDVRDGRRGPENYEQLGGTIDGYVVETASGGWHVYLAGGDIATTAGRLGLGIDSRGSDGYVVGAGSVVAGKAYTVVSDGPMLPAPQFVLDALPVVERAPLAGRIVSRQIEDDQPANVARAALVAQMHPPAVTGVWHELGFRLGAELCRVAVSPETALELAEKHWLPRGEGFKSPDRFRADILGGYDTALKDGEHGRDCVTSVEEALRAMEVVPPPDEPEAASAAPDATPKRLRITSQPDCKLAPQRRYVIKGLLAHGDVAIVLGVPGAGKSVLTPYLCQMVAKGAPAFGRKTRKGTVLYVAAEDPHGLKGRLQALGERHGDCPGFLVMEGATDLLLDEAEKAEVLRYVRTMCPAIVVLDTIAAAFTGLRENESDSMGQVVSFARQLATLEDGTAGPAVILVHHMPKNGDTPRGHGSLNGAADMVALLDKDTETGLVVARLTKNRNGPSFGVEMAFTIEGAVIGQDDEGDAITAAIGVEADPASRRCRNAKLTPNEAKALGFLRDLLEAGGNDVHRGNPGAFGRDFGADETGEVAYVDVSIWEVACATRILAQSAQKKAQSEAFRRVLKGLDNKGAIRRMGSFVWPADDLAE